MRYRISSSNAAAWTAQTQHVAPRPDPPIHPLSPSIEAWLYAWIALSVIGIVALAARGAYVWAGLPPPIDSELP